MSEKISRREFLGRGVAAAMAVAGVTACGRLLTTEAFAAGEAAEVIVGPDKMVANLAELKNRGAVNFMYNGKKSVLLYNNGEIRAFENICTHRGGPTKRKGDRLVCQWHGAVFDPLTGESQKPPAPKGSKLSAIPIEVKDGTIFVA